MRRTGQRTSPSQYQSFISLEWHTLHWLDFNVQHSVLYTVFWISLHDSDVNDGAVQCSADYHWRRTDGWRQTDRRRIKGGKGVQSHLMLRGVARNCSMIVRVPEQRGKGGHTSKKRASCPIRDPIQDPVRPLKARSLCVVQVFPSSVAHQADSE